MNKRDLWPLFCTDKKLVAEGLHRLKAEGIITQSQAAHWGLNLGIIKDGSDEINALLNCDNKVKGMKGVKFRLLRRNKIENPYQQCIKLNKHESRLIIHQAEKEGIFLGGGIGDHIEDASILNAWHKNRGSQPKWNATDNRKQQLSTFLGEQNWTNSSKSVSAKFVLAAIGRELPNPQQLIHNKDIEVNFENQLLCCWKADGKGDIISEWKRSVPFQEVLRLYKNIFIKYGASTSIIDISDWSDWEREILNKIGVIYYNPTSGDVLKLAETAIKSKYVVSIDTALAHICASYGKKCILMLPKFFDERWIKYMKKKSMYKQNCEFVMQAEENSWRKNIESLIMKINLDD